MKDLRFQGSISSDTINVTFRCNMFSTTQDNITIVKITDGEKFSANDKSADMVQKYFQEFKIGKTTLKALKDKAETLNLDLYIMNEDGSNWTTVVNRENSISVSG